MSYTWPRAGAAARDPVRPGRHAAARLREPGPRLDRGGVGAGGRAGPARAGIRDGRDPGLRARLLGRRRAPPLLAPAPVRVAARDRAPRAAVARDGARRAP